MKLRRPLRSLGARGRAGLTLGCILLALLGAVRGLDLRPAVADEKMDREVERTKREQDRQIASAMRRGEGLANVLRRYKQAVRDDESALNHYFLGRAYWYTGKTRADLRMEKRQALTKEDEAFIEKYALLGVTEMKASLSKDPNFWQSRLALVVISLGRNDVEGAKTYLTELRRVKPELPEGIRLHAQLLLAAGDTRGVEGAMLGLLKRDAEDDEARRMLVAVYANEEKWAACIPHLEKLLAGRPKDPDLRLMLIDALLGVGRYEDAEKQIRPFLREVGDHPAANMLRRRLVDAEVGRDNWPAAIATMREMWESAPDNAQVGGMLVEGLIATKDWNGALQVIEEIQTGLQAEEWKRFRPMFLWQRAVCFANLKRFEEALAALRELTTLRGEVLHVLDLTQQVLAELRRHEERLEVLRTMLPLVKDPEAKARLEEVIRIIDEALQGGPGAVGPSAPTGPIWSGDGFSDLLERCVHPDVEKRRKALYEYYEADVPFVDAVVYRRYDPLVEPDEECRIWVVRILGKYQVGSADEAIVRDAARYVGLALEDPTSGVRKVAAEELGRIGTPAGVLYLMPQLSLIRLDPLPTEESARLDLEEEYNATRLAMSKLTGQPDTEIGAATWVPLEEAARNREGWRLWLEKPEGVAVRLKALADLATVTDIDPRWQLRYALQDLVGEAPPEIALATYRVLRDAIRAIGAERIAADGWWPTFPMIEDADVTQENLPQIRKRIIDWWKPLPRSTNGAAPVGAPPAGSAAGK